MLLRQRSCATADPSPFARIGHQYAPTEQGRGVSVRPKCSSSVQIKLLVSSRSLGRKGSSALTISTRAARLSLSLALSPSFHLMPSPQPSTSGQRASSSSASSLVASPSSTRTTTPRLWRRSLPSSARRRWRGVQLCTVSFALSFSSVPARSRGSRNECRADELHQRQTAPSFPTSPISRLPLIRPSTLSSNRSTRPSSPRTRPTLTAQSLPPTRATPHGTPTLSYISPST